MEMAASFPSAAISDPSGVLGLVGGSVSGQAGQGCSDQDSTRPSESLCETNGEPNQQHSMQAGAVEVCMHSAQQRARFPAVAKAPGSGAVGLQDELHQGGGLRAVSSAGWCDGDSSSREGGWHGFSGAIPSQGIG